MSLDYNQVMIKIVPNILSRDSSDFIKQANMLKGFSLVDIDISTTPFTDQSTISLEECIKLLSGYDFKLSFHLMVQNPEDSIKEIIESKLKIEQIFIHQESDIEFVKKLSQETKTLLGIVIKRESRLKNIEFYSSFNSIQLMTGNFGGQGAEFDEISLSKSLELREMGYVEEIGIDGGVNLKSAKIIKDYPVDRVSVGSYFHQSENLELDRMKLDLALNLKAVD